MTRLHSYHYSSYPLPYNDCIHPLINISDSENMFHYVSGIMRSCPRSMGQLPCPKRGDSESPPAILNNLLLSKNHHQHCSLAIRNWRGKFDQLSLLNKLQNEIWASICNKIELENFSQHTLNISSYFPPEGRKRKYSSYF